MIGTDAFQETPIVEVTRQITKHNFLVMDINDLPRVLHEAFILAASGGWRNVCLCVWGGKGLGGGGGSKGGCGGPGPRWGACWSPASHPRPTPS
jgi:hypothetical protein